MNLITINIILYWIFNEKTKFDTGMTDNDGNMCPITCPTACPWEHKSCPDIFSNMKGHNNGCSMPDICIYEPFGLDGTKCYVPCPLPPPADHYVCPGGFDVNGCPMPDTYIPTTGTYINKSTSTVKVIMKSI